MRSMLCDHTAEEDTLMGKIKSYRELRKLKTFQERYNYLKMDGVVGQETFGFDRYLNQTLYKSRVWKVARNVAIMRDESRDLGIEGHEIHDKIIIHHMNPITVEDVEKFNDIIFDPDYLICTSLTTHNAIHYGDESQLSIPLEERTPNDTCPWNSDNSKWNWR